MDTQKSQTQQTSYQLVTAPLSIDQIKSYFENKDQLFVINYKDSQIKGSMLLTYISNLDLPCDIDFSGVDKAELHDLMSAYFETKSIVSSEILHVLAAKILLESNKINSSYLDCGNLFDSNDIQLFIQKNVEQIQRWNSFISSSFYFLLFCYKELADTHKIKNDFPEINDSNFVGFNIVKMYSIPGFLETYFANPISHPIYYFKTQFEDYIFKGQNLFHYFTHPNNILAIALDEVFQGNISAEVLNKAIANVP